MSLTSFVLQVSKRFASRVTSGSDKDYAAFANATCPRKMSRALNARFATQAHAMDVRDIIRVPSFKHLRDAMRPCAIATCLQARSKAMYTR